MSDMTPMKRFTDQISKFEHLIGSEFKSKNFNKSSPKSNWSYGEYYTSKGISNDFVSVFNTPFENLSFALTFQYINLPKEEQHVFASIKTGANNDDIIYSKPLNLEEFKEIIKTINNELEEIRLFKKSNIAADDIVQKFSTHFLDDVLNIKELLKTEKERYDNFLQDQKKYLELQKFEDIFRERTKKFQDMEKLIDTTIKHSDDYKELQKLKLRMNELNKNIEEATEVLIKKHKFHEESKLLQTSKEDLFLANMALEKSISEYKTGQIPSASKLKYKR